MGSAACVASRSPGPERLPLSCLDNTGPDSIKRLGSGPAVGMAGCRNLAHNAHRAASEPTALSHVTCDLVGLMLNRDARAITRKSVERP